MNQPAPYWKHIKISIPEYKPDQDSFTIKFDPAVDAIDSTHLYLVHWQEIVAEYQKSLSEYPLLRDAVDEKVSLKGLSPDSAAALRHNVEVVLTNALPEYKAFLKGNSLTHLDSQYLMEGAASVYIADLEKWAKAENWPDSPWMQTYLLENPKGQLPPITFLEGDEKGLGLKSSDDLLTINGVEYKILSWSSAAADVFFQRFPLLDTIYAMLGNDLANTYGRGAPMGALHANSVPVRSR